ncbi:VanZ family protein [Microbulbifer sp. OS29]|uniref:VanZ family protein n=1 Tax=Microbulbifer okhotskensis TaxID=2926617 RepID=A0A9X2EN41_9GAMM|nr:VanZ family protein [Microbulbifer okhotskensis]MCO1334734.1 VanZ family protein [Microbulbifer okhotskensis]
MSKVLGASAVVFFAFILWIFYLANTGSSSVLFDLTQAIPFGDKIGHIFLYGTFSIILILATRSTSSRFGPVEIYYGALAVLIFALTEEISQAFIVNRTFDLIDLVSDLIGVILANILVYYFNKLRRRKLSMKS